MRPIRTALAALGAVVVFCACARAQFGPTPVYLEPVEQRAIRQTAELVGTAEARRRAVVGAEVAGRVEAVPADAGDFVRAGDPLCRMRTTPVRLQLDQAQGQLAALQAALRKMQTGYRPEEIEQADARVKAAQAGFQRWQEEYERTKALLADGASTQSEMDATEAAYRQARELLAEAQAGLALLKSGYRVEDVEQARAQAAAQGAAVDGLKDTLDKMTVQMPFDGFVVRKMTEVGEWLAAGLPVAEVMDLAVVRVQLDVPERYLAGLERQAEAPVVFPALGSERQFAGHISQVVPSSAEGTHTVTVRVDVANEMTNGRPTIAAGLQARVWLPVGPEHEALLVPKAAVIRQKGRDLVYTVQATRPADAPVQEPKPPETPKEKEQAAMVAENAALIARKSAEAGVPVSPVRYAVAVPVEMVGGYGRYLEVRSARLAGGMEVVTRGTYLLSHGAAVQVRPKEGAETQPARTGGTAPAPTAGDTEGGEAR